MHIHVAISLTFLCLSISLARDTNAQPQDPPFKHFGAEDGFPTIIATAILQDHLGYLWIGTHSGLYQYDGYTATHFRADRSDPYSLSDRVITALIVDHAGNIWVSSLRGGLSRFDRLTGRFIHFRHDPENASSLSSDFVASICEGEPGVVWAATDRGLNRLDTRTGRFMRYRHDPDDSSSLSSDTLVTVYRDRKGILWVGGTGGLNRFDQNTGTFTRYQYDANDIDSLSFNTVSSITEDQEGKLWIGASNPWWMNRKGGGINRLDPETGTFTSYRHRSGDPNSLSSDHISALYYDPAGLLWIGNLDGGLDRLEVETGLLKRFQHNQADPSSIRSNWAVLSIFKDRTGILWIGTGAGVDVLDGSRARFRHYNPRGMNASQTAKVNAMYASRRDSSIVWVGTSDGLMRYDRTTDRVEPYRSPTVDLPTGGFNALYETSDGTLWIGKDEGLYSIDPNSGTSDTYRHDPKNVESLCRGGITSIIEDQRGLLWIGIYGIDQAGGISRLDRDTGEIHCYSLWGLQPYASNTVLVVYEAPSEPGVLWVGTNAIGLVRFDVKTAEFTSYFDPINLSSVRSIYEDRSGRLWIGSYTEGLHLFDRKTGTTRRFGENDGLVNDVVLGILEDEQGRLWISTNYGISRFDYSSGQVKNYTPAGDLPPVVFGVGVATLSSFGEMFFGGEGGFVAFDPLQITSNLTSPQVVISGLRLFNESLDEADSTIVHINPYGSREIVLTYGQNDVSFDYVGLHFERPENNTYAYMLEGYDHVWREAGGERHATYTNLPHGEYTFRVKAANSDGIWNEEGASLKVIILPPWWRTGWAYMLFGLLFAAGVFGVDRFQRKRLIRKERDRAALREASLRAEAAERELVQAREIERAYHGLEQAHAHLKATQAQLIQQEKLASLGQLTAGIAHEIKNPLNFVNNFAATSNELAEEIREAAKNGKLEEVLAITADLKLTTSKIEEHGKRADGIVRSMLLHAKGATGERTTTDLNALVEESLNLAYHSHRARVPDFDCTIEKDFAPSVGSLEMIPQEIGRVLLNLLGNAFYAVHEKATKFNGQYAPEVKVSTRRTEDIVEIRIEDNGPGIPESIREKIFEPFFTTKPTGQGTGLGLSLAYDIVTQGHGGRLEVESEEGDGAVFTIKLPCTDTVPTDRRSRTARSSEPV